MIRSRAPVALILYVAALEGRLVWQGPQGFALLEPPIARPEPWRNRGWSRVVPLAWLDRNWSTVLFGLPGFAAMAAAAALLPFSSLHLAALLFTLAGMVYVAGLMLVMLVWQLFFGRDHRPDELALDSVAAERWTMQLFHQEHPHRVDELLEQVRTRLHRLVTEKVRTDAADSGGQVGPVRLTTPLNLVHSGVTTEEALLRIEAVRGVGHPGLTMQVFDSRPEDVARTPTKSPAFFRFYLFAVVVVVLGIAVLVMSVERGECAQGCVQGSITYGQALAWVAYQLVWRQAPGVTTASDFSVVLGWLLSALLPMVLIVGVVAFRAQARSKRDEERKIVEKEGRIMGRTRVLVVTVNDTERDAVLDAIEGYTGRTVEPRFDGPIPVFSMGSINDAELFVVQAGAQGITNPAGALTLTAEAIRHVAPHYALIVGVCYGLRPKEGQKLGDVLVSERIRDLDHGKLVELEKQVREVSRGETVVASPMLLGSARLAQRGWERQSGIKVRFGPMLAWNKLIESKHVIEQLRADHPDAIGGDMEGAGFQAAARFADVQFLLIKSICDWGKNMTYQHQPMAAKNAAQFMLHLVRTGVLSHTPKERRGTA
ncbi:5'-methylthioadenosine/S-adenosylhomocysteine nucleosidase family protein [Lentzea sp. HUAS TT2]|uniref:5'-methylthioadenosine/S-adenosylhomocysteine nucleosidase family protein n=1 Tax=Lentzea sp. HUAS TT2 TaxID=3447454 RepID=UPI003F730DE7